MALAEVGPTSPLEMSVLEQNAIALGVSLDTLMENAGRAVAEEATRHLPPAPARVGVLVGVGNNGGDGTCAAYYLQQWGYAAELFVVRPPTEIRSPAARRCLERAAAHAPLHVGIPRPAELGEFALLVDALLGTGQTGSLRGPYREMAAAARESGVPLLSVDEPSGLGSAEALRPKWTVALTALKPGMTAETCGEIVVREIGIPPEARSRTGPGEFLYYPAASPLGGHPRPGRIAVLGGGPFAGAPALAGLAALRAGMERATVLAPLPSADRVQSFSPNLVVRAVGADHFRAADVPTILGWLEANPVDAVVIGMGAGRAEATLEAFRALLPTLWEKYPLVVDADALDALPTSIPEGSAHRPVVVATPNLTEYARVFGGEPATSWTERVEEVRRRAAALHLTLLVKGAADLLSDGGPTVANLSHPRALAVSGTGDLLAGVVGSLLARGVSPVPAARLASYWVGVAGYRAAARMGLGLLATDVLEELAPVLTVGLDRVGRRAETEATAQA
ncbi:MAG TPA: NAD(P)H-hydrate dehydratase [Thermoplasmata archaeon]|nr:NAD(P)H-hydrate dehydratase [Thermoplasmata archaeon]